MDIESYRKEKLNGYKKSNKIFSFNKIDKNLMYKANCVY